MKRILFRFILFVLAPLLAPFAARGFAISSGSVVLGEWNGNFSACRKLADERHIPMVMGWGYASDCPHCVHFHEAIDADREFSAWCRTNGFVMCYVSVRPKNHEMPPLTSDQRAALDFARWLDDAQTEYGNERSAMPMMAVYWRRPSGRIVKRCFEGRAGRMPCGVSKRTLGGQLMDSANLVLANYFKPLYAGGFLQSGVSAKNRLETFGAPGSFVEIPLAREDGFELAYTNLLEIADARGNVLLSKPICWEVGETNRFVRYGIPEGVPTGTSYCLRMKDAAGTKVSESALVWRDRADPALSRTSTANPKWLGEPFSYGEWTMDLDAATNFVARTPEAKFTLVVLGGPLWCPGCQTLETNILENAEFRAWTVSNKLTLVCLDQPRHKTRAGTLLSHEPDSAGASGSPYLSRKGISAEDAAKTLERNLYLTRRGWNKARSDRIPNPTFFLLRKDGTIVGRPPARVWHSPTLVTKLCRSLEELMSVSDDPLFRDDDNFFFTTKREMTAGETRNGKVIYGDFGDVYRLTNVTGRVRARVVGKLEKGRDVSVSVMLCQMDGNDVLVPGSLERVSGELAKETVATQDFDAAKGTIYLEVLARGLYRENADSAASYQVSVEAEEIPTALAEGPRVWRDIPVCQPDKWGDTNALGRLVGILSLALPTNGLATARLRTAFGDIAYVGRMLGTTALPQSVVLTPQPDEEMSDSDFFGPLRVYLDQGGAVSVSFEAAAVLVRMPAQVWSSERPATSWIGDYHVALTQRQIGSQVMHGKGIGFLSLKMTPGMAAKGVMSYVGSLPNGQMFSGRSVLQRNGSDVRLPILARTICETGDDVISGILRLVPPEGAYKAKDMLQCVWVERGGLPFWLHQTDRSTQIVSLEAAGGIFKSADMSAFCEEIYEKNELPLVIEGRTYGIVSIGSNRLTLKTKLCAGTMSFDYRQGMFYGEIRDPGAHIFSYRGLVLPGWGSNCAVCGGPQPTRPSFPFGVGMCRPKGATDEASREVRIGSIIEE